MNNFKADTKHLTRPSESVGVSLAHQVSRVPIIDDHQPMEVDGCANGRCITELPRFHLPFPACTALLHLSLPSSSFLCYVAAFAGDAVDGAVARKFNQCKMRLHKRGGVGHCNTASRATRFQVFPAICSTADPLERKSAAMLRQMTPLYPLL